MPESSSERDPVEELAEEFLARCRRGERPALSEYTNRYPQWAEKIRRLFPLLVDMEAARPAAHDGPNTGGVRLGAERKLERLGDYQVLREVGRGGMGIVYEAVQVSLGRHVALKVMPQTALLDPRHLLRFQREAKAAARLHHTNIVPVYGVGEENGLHYYVMQFIQGQSLDEVLAELRRLRRSKQPLPAGEETRDIPAKEGKEISAAAVAQSLVSGRFSAGPARGGVHPPLLAKHQGADAPRSPESDTVIHLPGQSGDSTLSDTGRAYWQSVAHVGVQVAEALAYASSQGILHRDIKPSNMLLDSQGTVWVTDFGLAKAAGSENLTRTGDVVGTLRYMPPERFQGKSDPRGDVYSLGITLYELATLRPAFADSDRARLMERVVHEEPPRPRKVDQHIPRDLETILLKAMNKEAAHRYATGAEMAEDLRRFLGDRPVRARPVGVLEQLWRWRRRNPVVASLTAAVFVLLATVAGVAMLGYAREAELRVMAQMAECKAKEEAERAQTAEQETRRQWYAVNLGLMQEAWDTNRVAPLQALLAETEASPDRGFEWYYWQRLCHRELKNLIGHRAQVAGVCWSPDGTRLATASWDRTAKVWEAGTGREMFTLRGHANAVHSVSWSPDGKRLATIGFDGTAIVWDANGGRELLRLKGHTGMGWCVSWSPDGKLLATGGADGTAIIWDLASRRDLVRFQGYKGGVISLSWSPDSRRLAAGTSDTAWVWQTAGGRQPLILKGNTGKAVAFSPDGKSLATAGHEGIAKVCDPSDGRELFVLKGHSGWGLSLSWSSDGRRLAIGYEDGTALVWDVALKREVATFKGHTGWVNAVSWSPDGKRLATASYDGTAKIWDGEHDPGLTTFKADSAAVTSLSWSPDGQRLASGGSRGPVKVWNAAEGRNLLVVNGHTDGLDSVSWSPDGKRLATGSFDGRAKVCEVNGEQPMLTFEGRGISWSPDGTRLATVCEDGTAKIWRSLDGRCLKELKRHRSTVTCVCWSPDGKRLATGAVDGTAIVWDAEMGEPILPIKKYTSGVRSIGWCPDGKWLATGNDDGTANLWNLAGGQVLSFKGLSRLLAAVGHPGNQVRSVSWSPDGKRLATATGDGTTKVWDPASGQELLTLEGTTVSWSPNGKRLATGSADGTVRIWAAASAEAVKGWTRKDEVLERTLARHVLRGGEKQGFIQDWLLLLPLPLSEGENGAQALDRQPLDEAHLRPQVGQRVFTTDGREWIWREHHSPGAILDFNAVLGRMTHRGIAYAVCYLESDRPRDDLWLRVASDDQGKVYLNGDKTYECREGRPLNVLDARGPFRLEKGTNALVFKVVNQTTDWEGCVRLVDAAGRPAQGIRVKLTPE